MKRRPPPYALWSEQNARYKPRNEDAAAAAVLRNRAGIRCLVGVVADGVSGLPNGDAAARLAVRGFLAELQAGTFRTAGELGALATPMVTRINGPIRELGDDGAGCTFTAAVVVGGGLVVIHLGDSTCTWIGRDAAGEPAGRRLTEEHTLVAAATAGGASDEQVDALHQHAIDRCLGDPDVSPQVLINPAGVPVERGRLLLATDGVTDVWAGAELVPQVDGEADLDKICRALCAGALPRTNRQGRPNKDNITCVVLDLAAFCLVADEGEAFAGSADDRPPQVSPRRQPWRVLALGLVLAGSLFAAAGWVFWIQNHAPEIVTMIDMPPAKTGKSGGGGIGGTPDILNRQSGGTLNGAPVPPPDGRPDKIAEIIKSSTVPPASPPQGSAVQFIVGGTSSLVEDQNLPPKRENAAFKTNLSGEFKKHRLESLYDVAKFYRCSKEDVEKLNPGLWKRADDGFLRQEEDFSLFDNRGRKP